jgi:RimJ/RimL family protein N-acetyltransferase
MLKIKHFSSIGLAGVSITSHKKSDKKLVYWCDVLLEGKSISLKIMEKEDLPLLVEWLNDPSFFGEYNPLEQTTRVEMEKSYDTAHPERKRFLVEKKDGTKIGVVGVFPVGDLWEIGFALIPNERGKGYGTEAVTIMVDYLFLSRDLVRIQASTDPRNKTSQSLLEKIGFKREGVVRKSMFIHGEWRDMILYSILREEWKEPRILTQK